MSKGIITSVPDLNVAVIVIAETSASRSLYSCVPGGALPYERLLGMCRWMGSHFHDWTDYNGVAFLVELLEWDRTFSGFLG